MSTPTPRLPLRPARGLLRRAAALGAGLAALGLLCAGAPRTATAATPGRPGATHGHAATAQKHKPVQKPRRHGAATKHKPARGTAREGALRAGAGAVSSAAPRRAADDAQGAVALPIQRVTLENGLRVVLSPDPGSPTVAVAVTYDAGSRDEAAGRSGVARLLEQMMFQGSRNVAAGDHVRLVAEHGGAIDGAGSATASTASTASATDCTRYSELVPADALALALWLEADRMRSPDLGAQAFEAERRAAQEHRAARIGAAYGVSATRLAALVFQGYWPYEHDALGSAEDLERAEAGAVRDFHAAHYGPGNAALSIAGDFDADAALGLVRRYFGGIPGRSVAPFTDVPFPEQTSQRTAVVKDPGADAPGILYGWAVPPLGHPDHYALEIAAVLLGRGLGWGESARLHQLLVRDKAAARSLQVDTGGRRGPDLFSIDARLTDGARVGDVEKLIEGELKALGAVGPSPAELAKAQRLVQSALAARLGGTAARARALGEHEILFGDATHLNGELPRYLAVTREDVQRVVRDHLGPTRRTIVETYPPNAVEPTQAPRAPAPAVHEAPAPTSSGKAAAKAASGHGRAPASHAATKKKPATKPKKR